VLASRLHAASSHDVTASSLQTRPTAAAAAAAGSMRRHSVLPAKKDCKSDISSVKIIYLIV